MSSSDRVRLLESGAPSRKQRQSRESSTCSLVTTIAVWLALVVGIVTLVLVLVFGIIGLTRMANIQSAEQTQMQSLASQIQSQAISIPQLVAQLPTQPPATAAATQQSQQIASTASLLTQITNRLYIPTLGWSSWGQNQWNWRAQLLETRFTPTNVVNSTVRCIYNTNGGVTANPTTTGDTLAYVPDWSGMLHAFNRNTCTPVWTYNITRRLIQLGANVSDPNIASHLLSRTSPAIDGNTIYFGTQAGAYAIALNRLTGYELWVRQVESHKYAVITAAPYVHRNRVYFGVASIEESTATDPAYNCCTFRGSVAALNPTTGAVIWKTYTLPDNNGQAGLYSGGSVWGSNFAFDDSRNTITIGTGNLYTAPPAVVQCQLDTQNITSTIRNPCRYDRDYSDSILSLDQDLGFIVSVRYADLTDAWVVSCGLSLFGIPFIPPLGYNCPQRAGPDFDFGQAPLFIPGSQNTVNSQDMFVIGQKAGLLWGVSASSLLVDWIANAGGKGAAGGMEFGSTTDGSSRVFYTDSNSGGASYTLKNGTNTTEAHLGAVDMKTGAILWQTTIGPGRLLHHAISYTPGIVWSGMVDFFSSSSGHPQTMMMALDANTGAILYTYVAQGWISSTGPSFPGDGTALLPVGYNSDVVSGQVVVLAAPSN